MKTIVRFLGRRANLIMLAFVALVLVFSSLKRAEARPEFNHDEERVQRSYSSSCSGDGIYLYEHAAYDPSGRCRKWTANDISLVDDGFNDIASSIRFVGSYGGGKYVAILYENENGLDGGGAWTAFGEDDPDFGDNEIGHDRASSLLIKKVPQCKGNGVYLYEDINYNQDHPESRCRKFTGNYGNFKDTGFNDIASSIKLAGTFGGGRRTVQLCVEAGYHNCTAFTVNDKNLGNNAVGHGRASSIKIRYTFDWPVGKPRGDGWGVYGNTFLQWANNGQGQFQYHQGVDISLGPGKSAAGKPVYAVYGAKVTSVIPGACIILEHDINGRKVWTQYKHVNATVTANSHVDKGQQIGTIYNDGYNSHLHFEVGYEPLACAYVVGKSCSWVQSHYENPFDWLGASGGKTKASSCP